MSKTSKPGPSSTVETNTKPLATLAMDSKHPPGWKEIEGGAEAPPELKPANIERALVAGLHMAEAALKRPAAPPFAEDKNPPAQSPAEPIEPRYQALFQYLLDELGATALQSEMQELIRLAAQAEPGAFEAFATLSVSLSAGQKVLRDLVEQTKALNNQLVAANMVPPQNVLRAVSSAQTYLDSLP